MWFFMSITAPLPLLCFFLPIEIFKELLGSFGDNELSPECLDGAQHLLNEGGISIPYRYRSYLTPVSTIKLHNGASHEQPLCLVGGGGI